MKTKTTISGYVDIKLKEKCAAMAEEKKTSISNIVESALRAFFDSV